MASTFYEIEEGLEVEFSGDITIENDGIGPYEFWGQKCYDAGHDYPVIENITWDKGKYTQEQNDTIDAYLAESYSKIEQKIISEY